jgi:DNA processing protein
MDDARAGWLRLWRLPGLGPATARAIAEDFGHPARFLEAPRHTQADYLSKPARSELENSDVDAALAADREWLAQGDHHLVCWGDQNYPDGLSALPDAPPVLFVHGDPQLLTAAQLALVGSRKPSESGRRNAYEFAEHLAGSGLVITSGLALGTDGAAHQGALDAGGTTIGVMATGPDRLYPARNRDLATRIAAEGALVTEFPTGIGVRRHYFPRRNRLISGLSLGVLVAEAGRRSGSLTTARHALEQGREVFAIPGSIHNPLARGCHQLIREGAQLVEAADDILNELPPLHLSPRQPPRTSPEPADGDTLDASYTILLDALGHDPQPLDLLSQRTGLTADTLSSMLLLLELRGLVASYPGGRYMRVDG